MTFSEVERNAQNHLQKDNNNSASASSIATDFYSAISSDDGRDDQFFDISDDEEGDEKGDFEAGETSVTESDAILELFREVDELFEGSSADQERAWTMLKDREAEVAISTLS